MSLKIKNRLLYILYIIFYNVFKIVPKKISKKLIDVFAFLAYRLLKKRYKVSMSNLNLVYGNKKNLEEKNKIILNSYKILGYNMFELLENQSLSKDEILKKANFKNTEIIQKALNKKRQIIFVTAHYGGWELTLPATALFFDMQIGVVNKKMQNPHLQKVYAEARKKNNITPIDKNNAAKGMLKTLRSNNQVAIVIDQYTDNGCKINFLGIDEIATDAVARLAIKLNALIIPILTTKNEFRKYEITIYDAINPEDFKDNDKIYNITKLQNDIISDQIFKDPDPWLWQHKRFRTNHSDIYSKE
ncbi:lipid A biosynthesis acyltransferase [Campylobacter ureolyticus]|uniref:LpxL/LpxP family acyltransferase n=1 Tax=Campylobacter ureolyticus TaxID=827 RepID=UPI00290C6FD5|nr:lipid A biosynthesis acyltransferase [Campylobacter ureolyticus]MDU7070548.1 lipid A biosynthesis acyltransferase [Campylobacter ureolyticus]